LPKKPVKKTLVKCVKHSSRKQAWIVCTHITDRTHRVYANEELTGETIAGHVVCEACYKLKHQEALRLACAGCVLENFGEPHKHRHIEEITNLFEVFLRRIIHGTDTIDLARVLTTYAVVACNRAPDFSFEELLVQVQSDVAKRVGGTSTTEKAPPDAILN